MNKDEICSRVERLRQWMREHGLQAYVIGSGDPHGSEYTPAHWQCRQWISGFDGSAGTAVVTCCNQEPVAALWTDSRYFLAAADALEGTPFVLMKERVEGTPSIADWLGGRLPAGSMVGVDGRVFGLSEAEDLRTELYNKYGIGVETRYSAPDDLWDDRPDLPQDPIRVQPMQWAGEAVGSKVIRLMDEVERQGCSQMLVSQLDEVAWLLNLRGSDVHCNPVFVSYCLVSRAGVTLFCDKRKIGSGVAAYLKDNGVCVQDYGQVEDVLRSSGGKTLISPLTNVAIGSICKNSVGGAMVCDSPISPMKSRKNEDEIRGMRQAMLQDGVALVKWLRWLEDAVPKGGETEMSIDAKLTALRMEFADFEGLSFDTIAAYREHGAIVHYEATPETDVPLKSEGLLLLDTGAQYACGTTDITRTLLLGGKATEEERRVYTLVLKGHIALSRLKFPRGASGTQLDLAARAPMWREGYNYGHGTGHGVGSHLCVHEGPHQIRMNYVAAPISEGMTVTDEPGIYLAGRFGVRIENVLLCVPHVETECGVFLGFEPLTLCPIDLRPVEWSMMNAEEIEWLDSYHATVAAALLPLLDDEADRQWLLHATEKIDNNKNN